MPTRQVYPFYFEATQDNKSVTIALTPDEEKQRLQDAEVIKAFKDYQRQFHERWARAGALYNVMQQGTPDDRVSNWYLGMSRMIIDQGITMMNQGEPEFDFAPIGPTDHKKIVIWKALVKYLLSKSNWKAHQEKWITDLHVFGSSPLECYTDLPQRLRRYENADGTIEEKVTRDFRRSKVGLRHRSIWHTYRNSNVLDPDDVPSGGYTEHLTRNQFVQNYMNVFLPDGGRKYKNLDQVAMASHYKVDVFFDELGDGIRVYALPYGNQSDGKQLARAENELGVPIFDKPLCIYRFEKDGRRLSGGANVPGMVPLCFGNFNDRLDPDFETHAVYGMGIPELIEGPESIFQAMMNMTVDNLRLKNTVIVGYEGADGKTAADIDNVTYFSGQFVDGKVTPQSMGIADITSNTVLWEWLNNICIWVTGINFQQIGGDQAKTAFEFAQRIRENNQRAKQRITSLENGPLKRAGMLLLSNGLSETTVPEWEDLTEEQAKEIAGRIENNEMTGEDYEEGADGKPARRRVQFYVPVQGKKYREDFTGANKKRTLNYKEAKNTLIEDPNLPGDVSYVPAVDTYLFPSGSIESILQFNVLVDGKGMLDDVKMQEMQTYEQAWNMYVQGAQFLPSVDPEKLFTSMMTKGASLDENDFLKQEQKGSQLMEKTKQAIDAIQNPPPPPNGQVPQAPAGALAPLPGPPRLAARPPAGGPAAAAGPVAGPPPGLTGVAAGTL